MQETNVPLNERVEQLNTVGKFVLLLLGANDSEPVPSNIHFQKEMYLLQKLFPELADETDYEPYFLGPYSEIVDSEAEELKSSGLIQIVSGKFRLTSEGEKIHSVVKQGSNAKEIQKSEEFKEFLNDLTKDELLAFIYFSYPSTEEFEKESIEYEDLLPKRRRLAVSMYQKGKISAQKAAQIAGAYLEDMLEELGGRKI